MDTLLYDIWLSLICGPGSPLPGRLFSVFENSRDIFEAAPEQLGGIDGLSPAVKKAFQNKDLSGPQRILSFCLNHNVGLLTFHDKQYPARLRRIDAPPVVLYYRGSLPDFDQLVCIAVVGTRSASEGSRRSAFTIARDLTFAGALVVSGMALGVDGAAAAGALDAGGHTVAVLGCGIDVVYPPQHEALMNRITVGGTVLTEFPPHSEPAGKNFPIRNRIISGLCNGTLVVAGSFTSGALITAQHALVQGRDIFAVPGDIHFPESEAPNMLIKDGAHIVTCAEDIVMEYAALYSFTLDVNRMRQMRRAALSGGGLPGRPSAMNATVSRGAQKRGAPKAAAGSPEKQSALKVASSSKPENFYSGYRPGRAESVGEETQRKTAPPDSGEQRRLAEKLAALGERERRVFDALCADSARSVDDLARGGMPVSEVLVALTMLEIDGLVEALPGGVYRKKSV